MMQQVNAAPRSLQWRPMGIATANE